MTTDKIIALAKEKLGKDITEQEARDFLDGKLALPDEALEIISGGEACAYQEKCPRCRMASIGWDESVKGYVCIYCGYGY